MKATTATPLATLAAALVLSAPALASAPASFTTLDACRTGPQEVILSYGFEGGACQKVGEPSMSEPKDGLVTVTMPTSDTSEVCTMQIVPVEGTAVLGLDETATELEVTVLYPDGREMVFGMTEIAGSDCALEQE